MLGRTHTLSGAATWVGGCAGLAALGLPPAPATTVVGAIVAAGCALLPDIDHPRSTIARTLGPVTGVVAALVAVLGDRLRRASCAHCRRGAVSGGHRAITHTAVFAVGVGLGVTILSLVAGTVVGLVVVWVAAGLAARAALNRRRGALGAVGVASAVTAVVGVTVGAAWWVGVAVTWGVLTHSVGDAATVSGAPLAWPLRIRGCRWRPVGTPRWLRFRTGGAVERGIWVFLVVGAVAGIGFVFAAS